MIGKGLTAKRLYAVRSMMYKRLLDYAASGTQFEFSPSLYRGLFNRDKSYQMPAVTVS